MGFGFLRWSLSAEERSSLDEGREQHFRAMEKQPKEARPTAQLSEEKEKWCFGKNLTLGVNIQFHGTVPA